MPDTPASGGPPGGTPITPEQGLAIATHFLRKQRLGEAEHALRVIMESFPGHPEALHLLGLCARERGDLAESAEYLLQAVRARPQHALYHASMGMVLLEQGAMAEAERALDLTLKLDPGLLPARYNRANLYLQTGRAAQAAQEYGAIIGIDPDHSGAQHNLAVARLRLGDRDAARRHLDRALTLAPSASTPWQTLAQLEAGEGHLQAALDALDQALQARTDVGEPHLSRGQILQTLGQFDEAEQAFRRFLAMQPRDAFLAAQALQALQLGDGMAESEWLDLAAQWRSRHSPHGVNAGEEPEPRPSAHHAPRVAVLTVSGGGPAGWLPDLLRALRAHRAEVHLWCVDQPVQLPEGVAVQALATRDPRRIAGDVGAINPDLLLQVGGLAAPELLLAALHRPAARVMVWGSLPRLGFPELDSRLAAHRDETSNRLSEQALTIPQGGWPRQETGGQAPFTASPSGALLVLTAPATLSPHRLALVHAVAAAADRPPAFVHTDFALAEIREALERRWESIGPAPRPLFDRDSVTEMGAAVMLDPGVTAPDAESRACWARGVPFLLLHPYTDPVAQAMMMHLWEADPEARDVPAPGALPEAIFSWAGAVSRCLRDPERWAALSESMRDPGGPSALEGLADRLIALLHPSPASGDPPAP